MRLQDLFEKRSNPELNPKIEPLEQLRRLEQQHGGDLYISFTQGFGKNLYPKLGINPRSSFNTPLGIYCYPVSLVIEQTQAEQGHVRLYGDDNGGLSAPFTGNGAWHNAWVFRLNTTNRLTAPMGVGNYARAIETLQTMWKGEPQDFYHFIEEAEQTADRNQHIYYFWNASRKMAGHLSNKMSPKISVWNQVLRKCGYTMAEDNGMGWIHENEPDQAVIFDPRIISPVDVIRRAEGQTMLHYGMRERANQDPMLLTKLPPAAVNRLAVPMARQILDNYLSHDAEGFQPSFAVGTAFLDNLTPDVCGSISGLFANTLENTTALVGWYGVAKTKNYSSVNIQGIRMLLHPELRTMKIDNELCDKIADLFYYNARNMAYDPKRYAISYTMADAVIDLLNEPDRFDNFQHFVTLFSKRDTLVGRFHQASKIADSLISKGA